MLIYYKTIIEREIALKLMDLSFVREMKSFFIATTLAFIVYYFFVIELSIWLFGYSLLCYRFGFILLFGSLICAW